VADRQRSEQYLTLSQFFAQLFRQVMGRPQCAQIFSGSPDLLPLWIEKAIFSGIDFNEVSKCVKTVHCV
jgi:hypothetical protein